MATVVTSTNRIVMIAVFWNRLWRAVRWLSFLGCRAFVYVFILSPFELVELDPSLRRERCSIVSRSVSECVTSHIGPVLGDIIENCRGKRREMPPQLALHF